MLRSFIKGGYALKRLCLGLTAGICILIIPMFLSGCDKNIRAQSKGGLRIATWSYALGAVSETDPDETKFSYSVELTNENERDIYIKSIEPSPDDKIKSSIIEKSIEVVVNKDIEPDKSIQIKGKFVLNTKGLTKAEIEACEPFVTGFKVSADENLQVTS
jgi:hypothetical protein